MLQSILQIIIFLGRASLAAVLVAAGAAKLADMQSFATTLRGLGMPVRQEPLSRGLALIVPLIELVLGIAIVSGLWPTVINGIAFVFMGSLSLVVLIALRKKLTVSCRCFGMLSDSQFSGKGLARSLLLTLLALVVFWEGRASSLRFDAPPVAVLILVAGFLLFGLAAGQAAKSIAAIKERMV
jgi:uncharacterized membrane protein YphA (DoxX/SURF4 family)